MAAWRKEIRKEQTSLKREAEKAMRNISAIVSFDEESVIIGEERYTDWKVGWKTLKKILSKGQKRNKQQVLQRKSPSYKAKYQNNMAKTTLGG